MANLFTHIGEVLRSSPRGEKRFEATVVSVCLGLGGVIVLLALVAWAVGWK